MQVVKKFIFLILTAWPLIGSALEGKFINPVTDVCWSCLFPIHVAGSKVTKGYKSYVNYEKKPLCHCPGGLVGLPTAFWEPTRLIDVTHTPYKLVALGGLSLGKPGTKMGGIKSHFSGSGRSSFYHVHYYHFPILNLLDIGTEFICSESMTLDIGYMSEFDPFWGDEQWTAILNPEVTLFANPLAQAACIPDCGFSTFEKPKDKLFWCAGCQGSLYPLTGYVSHHIGGIQASSLILHRLLAKLHNTFILKAFSAGNYCERSPSYRIRKSAYKTQLVYPIAQTKGPCNSLGRSSAVWGSGKSYPYKGEEFAYILWTKKHCCLDPLKISKKMLNGGGEI